MTSVLPSVVLAKSKPSGAQYTQSSKFVLHARVVTGAGGGPDKTILNSPRFLKPLGYDCACLFLRPTGDAQFQTIRHRASSLDARIVELDDNGPWGRALVKRAVDVCDELGVDIWHAHDYKTNLLGLLVRRQRPRLKLITTCHGWVQRTWRTVFYHRIDRFTLPRYERVIAVSPDIEQQCRRWGVPSDRLALIENAIDLDVYRRRQSLAEARAVLGWPTGENSQLIGAVGRLSYEKGYDLLIQAIGRLVEEGWDVYLAIAGEGPERTRLEQVIAALKLQSRIRLLGLQTNLIPFYEALDAFALSSRREGLPNVLLEAMAIGVPTVATAVAGVPRLIQDGVNGLLVSDISVEALKKGLARILGDRELGEALSQQSQKTIAARYCFKARMDKITALYDELLAKKPTVEV
jgi:glycosyltransferase involved in cell wall biosynthesis